MSQLKKLISSAAKPITFKDQIDASIAKLLGGFLGVVRPEQQISCTKDFSLKPHGHRKLYGSTHYGIMIPDLPEPYRYLSFASVVGYVGFPITDVTYGLSPLGKGDTASLVHGTALSTSSEAYKTYSIKNDLQFTTEPFAVCFGQDSTLKEFGKGYLLQTTRSDLEVEIYLEPVINAVTWFANSIFYNHFSSLMKYEGSITQNDGKCDVKGVCTLENWNAVATSSFGSRWITNNIQLPIKIFSYQVINLNDEEQLLLAFITYENQPIVTSVYYRNVQGASLQFDEASFEITQLKDQPMVTPDGNTMYVPEKFSWKVNHRGTLVLELTGVVDTPYCFGLAAGYVTSYAWSGYFKGNACSGRGYMEFIDKR